jgi:hypothetical protein
VVSIGVSGVSSSNAVSVTVPGENTIALPSTRTAVLATLRIRAGT